MNLKGASEDGKVSYNFNVGHLDDEGFTPGNELRRTSLSFGGRIQMSNKFSFNGTLNYTNTYFKSPPVAAGYGSNVSGSDRCFCICKRILYTAFSGFDGTSLSKPCNR